MAATPYQCAILRLLADHRRQRGESYVAGGVALNQLLSKPRRSRDIDLFHDSNEALSATWLADRALLLGEGYAVDVFREAPSFVEAWISLGSERVIMQWARDSAFRFFPLVEDELMGLALHPFDLATNKTLAMAGRMEARDWIDLMSCDEKIQPLGYLIWAACAKDPGFNPLSLIAEVSRSHYSQAELDMLDFEGAAPDAARLGERWHEMLRAARAICDTLPAEEVGKCVITPGCDLYRGTPSQLAAALKAGEIAYHLGRIGGAWPEFYE